MGCVLNEMFDEVYVINLDEDADRMRHFVEQASSIDLRFERWPATGRHELEREGYIGPLLRETKIPFMRGIVGRIGCALSHRRVVADCLRRGKTCLVFEDDAVFSGDFEEYLYCALEVLPNDWNTMYVSCGLERGSRWRVNDYWMRVGTGFWGWWAYGFRCPVSMQTYLNYHEYVLGTNFDTSFRLLGWGEKHSGIIAYRPIRRIVTQSKSFESRLNFKTSRGAMGAVEDL